MPTAIKEIATKPIEVGPDIAEVVRAEARGLTVDISGNPITGSGTDYGFPNGDIRLGVHEQDGAVVVKAYASDAAALESVPNQDHLESFEKRGYKPIENAEVKEI